MLIVDYAARKLRWIAGGRARHLPDAYPLVLKHWKNNTVQQRNVAAGAEPRL